MASSVLGARYSVQSGLSSFLPKAVLVVVNLISTTVFWKHLKTVSEIDKDLKQNFEWSKKYGFFGTNGHFHDGSHCRGNY